MKCKHCQSAAIMESGICLSCGFRNPPKVDKARLAEEKRLQAQQVAKQKEQQQRQTAQEAMQNITDLMQQGQLQAAWDQLSQLQTPFSDLEHKKVLLEAQLWAQEGLPEKQLETLEPLQSKLPFEQENLDYYYQLACIYQQQDSPGKAFYIFNQFLENRFHNYKDDILQRYRELKESGISTQAGDLKSEGQTILIGGMEQTVESLRGWIEQANRVPEYFRASILLNQNDYEKSERIDKAYTGELQLDDIINAVNQQLIQSGLDAFQAKSQGVSFYYGGPQGQQKNTTTMLLTPIKSTSLNHQMGTVQLGVEVAFTGKTGLSLYFYEFFTPIRPEDLPGAQPDIRDFNDDIRQTVMTIHQTPDLQKESLLQTLRDIVKKTLEAELEKRAQTGFQSFF